MSSNPSQQSQIFAPITSAIRALAMDAVQQANSGHPGAPMGMAEIAEVLWRRHLRHNPANPHWPDRDRFVLSNGHGSMLLYALLHLTGYDLTIDDLKNFRQLHSKTAGHPEFGITAGVETTTGPLGQGIANAVGMALAEKVLAAEFNRPGHEIIDHHTYAFLGDGCLMEGVSHEVCSLAGTLGLGKLIAFWDDNGISIDGHVEGWFTDDTPKRFKSYGWHVIAHVDGHDGDAIELAILAAKSVTDKPSLICCKTTIGRGSPNKQGSHDCHGAPLGSDEVADAREYIGWPHAPFEIPSDVYAAWNGKARGAFFEENWRNRLDAYQAAFPAEAAEFERRVMRRRTAGQLGSDQGRLHRRLPRKGREHRHPQGLAECHRRHCAGPAGTVRRLGRPRRLQPDPGQGQQGRHPQRGRQLLLLRCPRIRDDRHRQRHRAAWRPDSLHRHLPRLLRLRPQRHPHGRADEAAPDHGLYP